MNFSLNTNSTQKILSPEQAAELAAKAGFQAMEWGLPALDKAPAAAKRMTEAARKAGLKSLSFLNAGTILKPETLLEWGKIADDSGVGDFSPSSTREPSLSRKRCSNGEKSPTTAASAISLLPQRGNHP